MKHFTIILFAVFFGLRANAQTAPKPQDIPASQETQQPAESVEKLETPTASKPDVRKEVGAKDQESDTAKTDKSSHRFSFLGLEVPDFVALGLGLAALAISMCGLKRNRISNEKQNRAYVFIERCELLVEKENNLLRISLHFKNSGVTPAYKFKSEITVNVRPQTEFDASSTLIDNNKFQDKSSLFIAGGDHKPENLEIIVSAGQMRTLLDGSGCVKLNGVSEYLDAFGKTQSISYKFKASKLSPKGKLNGEMIIAEEGLIST